MCTPHFVYMCVWHIDEDNKYLKKSIYKQVILGICPNMIWFFSVLNHELVRSSIY